MAFLKKILNLITGKQTESEVSNQQESQGGSPNSTVLGQASKAPVHTAGVDIEIGNQAETVSISTPKPNDGKHKMKQSNRTDSEFERMFSYTVMKDGGARIDKYLGSVEVSGIQVPGTLGGHPVTIIGFGAFVEKLEPRELKLNGKTTYKCSTTYNVKIIYLPDTIREIGDYAFANFFGLIGLPPVFVPTSELVKTVSWHPHSFIGLATS